MFICSRFKHGKIYTYIGEVCVSVNPYKTMNIYDQKYIDQYKGTCRFGIKFDFRTKVYP